MKAGGLHQLPGSCGLFYFGIKGAIITLLFMRIVSPWR